MSNANGPLLGQNGLSPGGEAGLDQRVVQRGGEDRLPGGRGGLDLDRVQVLPPGAGGLLTPVREGARGRHRHGRVLDERVAVRAEQTMDMGVAGPWGAVDLQVGPGLVHSAQREAEPHLDHLAGVGGPAPHQAERPQGGRADAVEVQPGAAVHQPPVVPQQLPPVSCVALDVGGQRGALHDGLGLDNAGTDGLEVRAQGDGRAVGNVQPAHREVDHDPGVAGGREGVAVHGATRAHGQLAADPGAEGARVVAGLGPLVEQVPALAQAVQRLQHRGHPEIVVVLPDGPGPGLLEVGEAGRELPVVQLGRHALGVQLVAPVTSGVGAGVRARRHHAERERRAGMGVADLRLRPPPRLGQSVRDRQVGGRAPDEGVDVFDHGQPPGHRRRC